MAKYKVAVLGCTGMLGAMVLDYFSKDKDFEVIGTYRSQKGSKDSIKNYSSVNFCELNAETAAVPEISRAIKGADWVVNAIGVIKPYIHDDNAQEVERATKVNALFPHYLAKAAEKT